MANEQNLNHKLTVSELRKGGQNSGKARREKKTIQKILADLLNSEIKDSPQFAKLAAKMGVASDKSVKEMFSMVCLLNSVKSGNLGDLEKLSRLLGEETQYDDGNNDVESTLAVIRECAYADRDKP